MCKTMNKGQTMLSVVMWATGISLAVGGTFYTRVAAQFDKQSDINQTYTERITRVEEQYKQIDEKLNLLLKVNGINPKTVE